LLLSNELSLRNELLPGNGHWSFSLASDPLTEVVDADSTELLLSNELLLRNELSLGNQLLLGNGHWSFSLDIGAASDSLTEVVEASSSPDSGNRGGDGGGKLLDRGGELLGSNCHWSSELLGNDGGGGWDSLGLVPVDDTEGQVAQFGFLVDVRESLDLLVDVGLSSNLDVLVGNNLRGGGGRGSKTN